MHQIDCLFTKKKKKKLNMLFTTMLKNWQRLETIATSTQFVLIFYPLKNWKFPKNDFFPILIFSIFIVVFNVILILLIALVVFGIFKEKSNVFVIKNQITTTVKPNSHLLSSSRGGGTVGDTLPPTLIF